MTPELVIRQAVREDARAIIDAHHAAVRERAAEHYSPEIIDAWAPEEVTDARVQRLEEQIQGDGFYTLVAETGGDIIGFGQVNPQSSVLGAVYVRKNPLGGMGERILTQLVHHAREQGAKFLAMEASLNSEAFYRRNGFKTTGYGKHRIGTAGIDMDCVHMMIKLG